MHHHHAAIRTRLSTASSSSCFAERRALFASNCSSSRRVRSSTRLWAALEGPTARASSRGALWPAPWPFMAAAAGGSRVATAHRMNARHTGACQCLRRMRSAVVIARRQTSCNTWDTWAHVSQTQLRSRRRGHQTHPRKFRFEGVGVQQKRIALPGQHLRTNQHTNQHTNVTVRDVPVGAGGLRRPTRQLDVCSTNHVPTSPLGPFTQARTRGRHPLQAVHA